MFKRAAFTLIELLVVIAIIAILAAILFPVFARAKEAAKKTQCLSSTKQIALSQMGYCNDYDDMFPLEFTRVAVSAPDPFNISGTVRTYTWQNLVQPYMKNWGIFICPVYNGFNRAEPIYKDPFLGYGMIPRGAMRADAASIDYWADTYYQRGRSCRFDGVGGAFPDNGWATGPMTGVNSASGSNIANPANTVSVTEGTAPDFWMAKYAAGASYIASDVMNYYIVSWYPGYGSQTFGFLGRHMMKNQNYISFITDPGYIQAVYCDGHAKSQEFFNFLAPEQRSGYSIYKNLWPRD